MGNWASYFFNGSGGSAAECQAMSIATGIKSHHIFYFGWGSILETAVCARETMVGTQRNWLSTRDPA